MCGLAGVAAFGGVDAPSYTPALLRSMTRTIAHRGPDDAELLQEGPVGLGFVRLSLVDPENGSQPLRTDDGDLVLIANGEVYNHRELAAELGVRMRTGSDCEVLLHLYRRFGLDFLDRVRGMFSLVLWDRRQQRLVIGRDRFGIKPVYFHANRDRIVFASEIKALLHDPACPRELDWGRALADQLMTGNPLDVDPSGGAHLIARGQVHVIDSSQPRTVQVDLGQIGYRLHAGHRLRLHISSSDYPEFIPQAGNGEHPWLAEKVEKNQQMISVGGQDAAYLSVQVLPNEPHQAVWGPGSEAARPAAWESAHYDLADWLGPCNAGDHQRRPVRDGPALSPESAPTWALAIRRTGG
jgi:asparagine synthetase B (glutamine-hydrolysing)